MSYNHVGDFKNLSKAGKDATWNTLGTLSNLLPEASKSSSFATKSTISNGTIIIEGQQYEWDCTKQDYYPVEIYHLDGRV